MQVSQPIGNVRTIYDPITHTHGRQIENSKHGSGLDKITTRNGTSTAAWQTAKTGGTLSVQACVRVTTTSGFRGQAGRSGRGDSVPYAVVSSSAALASALRRSFATETWESMRCPSWMHLAVSIKASLMSGSSCFSVSSSLKKGGLEAGAALPDGASAAAPAPIISRAARISAASLSAASLPSLSACSCSSLRAKASLRARSERESTWLGLGLG